MQRVDPHVALGMVLRRLRDALHPCDFGQHLHEQTGLIEQFESAAGVALGEHFGQLVAHALAADGVNASGEFAHGSERCLASILNPKRAAKRTARSRRSWSSSKRCSGRPMARMMPASRSASPPT